MPGSLTARLLLRIGRSLRVRPIRAVAVALLPIAACLAVCFLTEWSDSASINLALRIIAPAEPAEREKTAVDASTAPPAYLDLLCSETVLARTLAVVTNPESPAASEWRKSRRSWEDARSAEAWANLSRALHQLDAEIERLRGDQAKARSAMLTLDRLSERVSVSDRGEQDSLRLIRISLSWPVKCGDIRPLAECLAMMAADRVLEVQMNTAQEAADNIRLRRESLRPIQLAPVENALRQFIEKELDSPADLLHLDQLNRSPAEADLPVSIKRMRQELLSLDSQRAEAQRLRRLLLESLPASLWNGVSRRGDDGELTAPDVTRVGQERLADNDPVLAEISLVIPREALDRNIVLSRLKARETELLLELNKLRSEFNPGYLGIGDKKTELTRTRREILTQVIGEAAQLAVLTASISTRQTEMERRIEAAERQLERLNGKLSRYQQLAQDLEAARKRYLQTWLDETQAMQSHEQGLPAAILHVLDVSGNYAGRRALLADPRKAAVLGTAIGLALAVAYALAASLLDKTLRWPDEVEQHVGVRVVGRIRKVGDRIVA